MSNSLLINLSALFSQPTGIGTYAQNVITSLGSLEPTLLTAQKFDRFNCYSIADNMTPAQRSKGHLRRLLWTQFQLPQIYRKLNAKLLYSPVPEAPLYSSCRYIVMCHDLIPLRFPRPTSSLTNYFRYAVPLILKQAEHIICNSQATAQDIVDFYGIAADKITPIYLAYDDTHFYPRQADKVHPEFPYFLYLGRQDPYKNIQGLITAFAEFADRDCQLWVAGTKDARYTPKLEQQAAELKIANRIKFLDYLDYQELPWVISQAIALVFPTLWEGFGLPVLEAMACGTPVITSNLASLPEITGEAAILVDPKNTAEITAAMKSIAQDRAMRSQLSNLGLQQAKLFSWAKTGDQTKQVLAQYI